MSLATISDGFELPGSQNKKSCGDIIPVFTKKFHREGDVFLNSESYTQDPWTLPLGSTETVEMTIILT